MTENETKARKAFNNLCSCADTLTAYGLGCYEQRDALRRYLLVNRHTGEWYDITINTARNEWISRKDNRQGQVVELMEHLGLFDPTDNQRYVKIRESITNHYRTLEAMPINYPTIDLHIGRNSLVDDAELSSHDAVAMLTREGISMRTAIDCGVREVRILYPKAKEVACRIAFPTDNGDYSVFDGKTFRPLFHKGISTVGRQRLYQTCNVFENWLDYLAFQERRHRTGQYLLSDDYHLIINGKANIKEAEEFLRHNPDFMEVRSFMPETDVGKFLTARIMDATKGTVVNCSATHAKDGSILAALRGAPPHWFETYKRQVKEQESAVTKQTNDVQAKQAITTMPEKPEQNVVKPRKGSGKEQTIVIGKHGGGMSM